ncbi:MAG: hypothetical protein GX483_04570 [Actinomycetaceae bacterium]|nr:hypothetical protein [Actinomycetaceae bacterium]
MSTSFAHAGKRIADRFELTELMDPQAFTDAARSWVARDTALSVQVRAIVIDPDSPMRDAAIDAARRTAFIHTGHDADPNTVAIMSVIADEDASDFALITEVPPGRVLSSFLDGTPVDPETVRALLGEVASAVNSLRHHGIRHLCLTTDDIYLTDAGQIIVDGYGIRAALAGKDMSRPSGELDREEAIGLTVLLAAVLLGRPVPELGELDVETELFVEAHDLADLPQPLVDIFDHELSGEGAVSPDDLMLRLVPWGELDLARFPVNPSKTDASVASADSVEEFLGLDDTDNELSQVQWPKLGRSEADADTDGADDADADDAEANETDIAIEPADTRVPTKKPAFGGWRSRAQGLPPGVGNPPPPSLPAGLGYPPPPSLPPAPKSPPSPTAPFASETSLASDASAIPATQVAPEIPAEFGAPPPPSVAPDNNWGGILGSDKPAKKKKSPRRPILPDLEREPRENETKVDATKITIVLLILVVLIGGWFGIRGLFKPFDDVEVTTPELYGNDNGVAPVVVSIELIEPDGADQLNTPEGVELIIDGDPDTWWNSYDYSAESGATDGFGFYVQLERLSTVSAVELTLWGTGGNIQLRETVKEEPTGGNLLAQSAGSTTTTLTPADSFVAEGFVIWITDLPVTPEGLYQFYTAELVVY